MSNPVMTNLAQEARTPAGYPTMPGYTPNSGAQAGPDAYAATAAAGQAATWGAAEQQQWEQRFQAPAADATDRGQVTMDDIVVRTGMLFVGLLLAAAAGWTMALMNPGLASMLALAGTAIALVLVLVITFKKAISKPLIVGYTLAEGVALGAISAFFEFMFPGIVVQAVIATLSVFAVTLTLFKLGIVRNSPKLMKIVTVGIIGVILYGVASLVLTLTGAVTSPFGLGGVSVMGIPLGVIVGVVAVFLGAASLVVDFDIAQQCVRARMPRIVAWQVAFGLMVTIVWLYLELLRLIAILRSE